MRITDHNVHGRTVLTADGIAIGEISKLYLDGASFTIASVEVRLRKEAGERLGFSRSILHRPTIEIPTSMVQSVGDAVLLGVAMAELRAIRSETTPTREAPDVTTTRTDERPPVHP